MSQHNIEDSYPIKELARWHTILTGSCPQGISDFAQKNNIDVENGTMTVLEFIEIAKGNFGSKTIERLEDFIKEGKNLGLTEKSNWFKLSKLQSK